MSSFYNNWNDKCATDLPYVDEQKLLGVLPSVNMESTNWLHSLDISLGSAKHVSAAQLRNMFMSALATNRVDGPHQLSILEIAGPKIDSPTSLIIIAGEVHGNPSGCRSNNVPTIFGVLSNLLRTTCNVFLILESFFHLIPFDTTSLHKLSKGLKERAGNSEHSVWHACECIASDMERCHVGSKSVGQLIVFRSFSFIVQSVCVYLDSIGITKSNFHNLYHRIYHMDPREDANMRPYDWLDPPRDEQIPEMLQEAIPIILSFTPKLESEDLREWYTTIVQKSILDKIHECIKNPCKHLYEDVFTTVTEIVTMSLFFHILEKNEEPHFLMVVGDSHRVLILKFIKQCLGKKVLSEKTYSSLDGKLSCTNIQ